MSYTLHYKNILGLLFTLSIYVATTNKSNAQKILKTLKAIDTEVSANSQAHETLGESCKTIGHRLTGSSNGIKAVASICVSCPALTMTGL